MRRFTEAEAAQWEAVWEQAHSEVDPDFDAQRDALHLEYAPRIIAGDNATLAKLLARLDAIGMCRALPEWRLGEAPSYPRGIGTTTQGTPTWIDSVDKTFKKDAGNLKREAIKELSAVVKIAAALLVKLKAGYRAIDEAHNAALWTRVRELFDYPVFVAAPKTVGITSTGETGEGVANDLPGLLSAYRDFERWVERGARAEDVPSFSLPSAA